MRQLEPIVAELAAIEGREHKPGPALNEMTQATLRLGIVQRPGKQRQLSLAMALTATKPQTGWLRDAMRDPRLKIEKGDKEIVFDMREAGQKTGVDAETGLLRWIDFADEGALVRGVELVDVKWNEAVPACPIEGEPEDVVYPPDQIEAMIGVYAQPVWKGVAMALAAANLAKSRVDAICGVVTRVQAAAAHIRWTHAVQALARQLLDAANDTSDFDKLREDFERTMRQSGAELERHLRDYCARMRKQTLADLKPPKDAESAIEKALSYDAVEAQRVKIGKPTVVEILRAEYDARRKR